jgi:5-hydroxyisourate hydrolase
MSQITTHVLDVSRGVPASGVSVVLELQTASNSWKELGKGATDNDGRLRNLLTPGKLGTGTYRLTFDTGVYFAERKIESLYPKVNIIFEVRNAQEHYHIPLLLSPFGYSTYRGS